MYLVKTRKTMNGEDRENQLSFGWIKTTDLSMTSVILSAERQLPWSENKRD